MTTPTATQLPAGTWVLDPAATALAFRTRHLFGAGAVTGTFAASSATVTATVSDSGVRTVVEAIIPAASFSTGEPKRDTRVLSAKFLDAAHHPDITFHADRATPTNDG